MPHLYTWPLNERRKQILEAIKKIPDASRKDTSKLIELALEEYIKQHGSGNPAFKLDQFVDKDFHIAPAFFSNSNKWLNYAKDLSNKEYSELRDQIRLVEGAIIDSKRFTRR